MRMKKLLHLDISKDRTFGLDILRAIAIMIVLFTHNQPILPTQLSNIIDFLYFDGVSIFFILSSFLIGSILIKTFETNGATFKEVSNFWVRRWFRTLPAYFFFILIITILSKIFIEGFPLKVTLPYFIFTQNLISNTPGFFGESWSLSIEEWFYLMTPLLILSITKLMKLSIKHSFIIIIGFFLLFSPTFRYIMYSKGLLPRGFYQIVIYRTDSIIYGALGAFIAYYYSSLWRNYVKELFSVSIILLLAWKVVANSFSYSIFYLANFDLPFFSLAVLCTLPFLSNFRIKKYKIFHKVVIYISLISYSLYLVNYSLVKKLIIDNMITPCISDWHIALIYSAKTVIYWSFTFIIAFFSYKYIEVPTTKLRNLFSK